MLYQNDIDSIIQQGIEIIKTEITKTLEKQTNDALSKQDTDNVLDCLKALVIIKKDWRIDEKDKSTDTKRLTDAELEAAIIAEAEKLKGRSNAT